MSRVKETVTRAQAYNKGIAAAVVTLGVFIAGMFNVEIPADVQGAVITLAVLIIPNR